jgi:hypothetical protein
VDRCKTEDTTIGSPGDAFGTNHDISTSGAALTDFVWQKEG